MDDYLNNYMNMDMNNYHMINYHMNNNMNNYDSYNKIHSFTLKYEDMIFLGILGIIVLIILLSDKPKISPAIERMQNDISNNIITDVIMSQISSAHILVKKNQSLKGAMESLHTPYDASTKLSALKNRVDYDIHKILMTNANNIDIDDVQEILNNTNRFRTVIAYSIANRLQKINSKTEKYFDLSDLASIELLCISTESIRNGKLDVEDSFNLFMKSLELICEMDQVNMYNEIDVNIKKFIKDKNHEINFSSLVDTYFTTQSCDALLFSAAWIVGGGPTDHLSHVTSLANDFTYIYSIYDSYINYYEDKLYHRENRIDNVGFKSHDEFYLKIESFVMKATELQIMTNGLKHIINYMSDSVSLIHKILKNKNKTKKNYVDDESDITDENDESDISDEIDETDDESY